jgi:hypothetical protein
MTNFGVRLIVLLLLSACVVACNTSSVWWPWRQPARAGSVRIHSGSVEDFRRVDCVRIEGTDTESGADVSRHVLRELRGIGVHECGASTVGAQLRAFYQAGPGVCIDCEEPSKALRSGFALIAVERDGSERARAEWQYTAGGSANAAAAAFGRELVKLLRAH